MTQPEPAAGEPLADDRNLVGTVVSERYRIDKVLGVGGMGAVYQAEHLLMRKRVAVKVLHAELTRVNEAVQRFEREAMAAAHIEHPNVAAATDFGKLPDGSFFLVLEFVEGKNLRDLLEIVGRLDQSRAVHITRQILQALNRAHGLGIVHRDLKPENVMLIDRDGDPDFVKVLDFGIAKVQIGELNKGQGSPLTQMGMVYGTPEYMAPEQALGQDVDARADLYAVGVMFFEMMVGRRPFVADNPVQLLGQVVSQPVPQLSAVRPDHGVSSAVEDVCRKLLSKVPNDRYGSARDALTALNEASGMAPASSQSLPVVKAITPSLPEASRNAPTVVIPLQQRLNQVPKPVLFGVSGAAALVILGVIVAAALRTPPAPATTEGSASASASAAPPEPDKPSDADIEEAAKKGVEALEALAKRAPGDGRILRALAKARADARQVAAFTTWGELFDAEPAAARDKAVGQAIVNLTLASPDAHLEPAVALMSTKMGDAGPDLLYDLMIGKVPPKVAKRAKDALATPEVREKASPALKAALDLRQATTSGQQEICRVHKQVFAAAKENGDARSLFYLNPLTSNKGCGFLKRGDCYTCLRDGSLNEAITAIRGRSKD